MTEPRRTESRHRFSGILEAVQTRARRGPITLRELLDEVGPKGHSFLTLFLVLPFMQPVPLPGLSTLFGLTIALVGAFFAIDRAPWIPSRFARVQLKEDTLLKICAGLQRVMVRLEKWVRPRGTDLFERRSIRRMNGLIVLAHGLLLSLPLPIPFSNFLPALVLFLTALGTLEEDALVVGTAYLAAVINACFFAALVIAPMFAIRHWT